MIACVRKKIFFLLILCVFWSNANTTNENDLKSSTPNIERQVENLNFPHNLNIILQVLTKLENKECVRDIKIVLEAMSNEERWTLEMFDSFPKFPTGILYGNYYQLGNFDECVNVLQPLDGISTNSSQIKGQYCLADVKLLKNKLPTKFKDRFQFNNKIIHWGICLPSSCSSKEAKIFVKEIFTSIAVNVGPVEVSVQQNNCQTDERQAINPSEIVYCVLIALFLVFVLFASGFHCYYLRNRKKCVAYNVETARQQCSVQKEVIFCFSVIRNTDKFLQTKPSELNLECIAGIKFLSMVFIICGHSLVFIIGGPVENIKFLSYISLKIENSLFFNSVLLVDTFLLVGGFLLCRLLLLELEKRKGKFNVFILYIGRYVRLTPSYAIVIFLYMTILYRLGDGPLWNSKVGLERERCLQSWWTNLLYINNYVQTDNLCMFQSWYLAVDYHLFIVAPGLIYLLWWKSKLGEIILLLISSISVLIPFLVTYINNYDPTFLAYAPEIADLSSNFYFVNVYIKTHMRASSYFIGVALGYLIHKLQSAGTKLPSVIIGAGWFISTVFGLISMFSIVVFFNQEHETNAFESAIYAALHRVAWSLAISWIILVCVTENANLVNKFLSWKLFIPLSRLTYCAYLVNGFVEIYSIGTIQQPTHLSIYELATRCLAHLVLTFFIAFLLCILFESPLHGLEKILINHNKVQEQQHNANVRPVDET